VVSQIFSHINPIDNISDPLITCSSTTKYHFLKTGSFFSRSLYSVRSQAGSYTLLCDSLKNGE
jgi:hypothetical protein